MVMVTDRPFYTKEDKRWDLILQEMEIKRCFPQASVKRKKGILLIKMPFRNPGCHRTYNIGAIYRPNVHPLVVILEPSIKPLSDIHIYADGNLCLYDPADIGYRKRFSMAKEVLPWTFKWILYYEAWLTNGHYWMGPETAHGIRMTEEELDFWYRRRSA